MARGVSLHGASAFISVFFSDFPTENATIYPRGGALGKTRDGSCQTVHTIWCPLHGNNPIR